MKMNTTKFTNSKTYQYILLMIIAFLQFFQLQVSAIQGLVLWTFRDPLVLVSIGIILVFVLLASLYKPLLYIQSVIITIYSIANYYTCKFHGNPLLFTTLKNAKTALAVTSGYKFTIGPTIIIVLIVLLLEIFTIRKIELKASANAIAPLAMVCLTMAVLLLQNNPHVWSYKARILFEGFPMAFLRDLTHDNSAIKPIGYAEYESEDVEGTERPDIILILNESYSTLSYPSELSDIATTGKIIVPSVGGGTNNSEFELLTSNSMALLNEDAPFNYLTEKELSKSNVNYLKSLGYETSGWHCQVAENYNRIVAYPLLGFDEVHLGKDGFTANFYGRRLFLDIDNYNDVLKTYNPDKPRFTYILTYQNHGGYEQNDESFDTVHKEGYGKSTDEVNEFLTSVKMSEDAFRELVGHFEKSDRPTIICMVGDHNPSFIQDIESDYIKQVSANYAIWANYDVDFDFGTITMTDVLPTILKDANVSHSGFMESACRVHDKYPVHTRDGKLVDSNGNSSVYDGTQKELAEFYSLEYDRLTE